MIGSPFMELKIKRIVWGMRDLHGVGVLNASLISPSEVLGITTLPPAFSTHASSTAKSSPPFK